MPDIPFRQARWYTQTVGRRAVTLVVIHDGEVPEKPDSAEGMANYFATTATQASAHYSCDADSIVQSVRLNDVAWAAPGANHQGIQIEHAGYAAQSANQWGDSYSEAMLGRSAALTASLCATYNLPLVFVDAAELIVGQRGITTHAEVSKAWRRSDHTDPGPNFPMTRYIGMARRNSAVVIPPAPGGPDMANVIGALVDPAVPGGVWVFARDGGVFCYGGARWFGSYPGLPAAQRQGERHFDLPPTARDDGREGYQLVASDAATYRFGP